MVRVKCSSISFFEGRDGYYYIHLIYLQSFFFFLENRQKVLYFGDHIFSDLIDPTVEKGWRTGAIIHELEAEIETRNTASYRHTLAWLLRIEQLIQKAQSYYSQHDIDGSLESLVNEWSNERRNARHELRNVFNKSFGSLFRTYQNPTYFANKIRTVSDPRNRDGSGIVTFIF